MEDQSGFRSLFSASVFDSEESSITALTVDALTIADTIDLTEADIVGLDTADVTETTNLYFTTGRVDAQFATKTTDDLTEGKSNLYFTELRVTDTPDVKSNTTHRARTDNPHTVTLAQLGITNVGSGSIITAPERSLISTNAAAIAAAETTITLHTTQITTNIADIKDAVSDIGTNTDDIKTNITNIETNTADILTLEGDMLVVEGKITTAETDITTNATNITTNTAAIAAIATFDQSLDTKDDVVFATVNGFDVSILSASPPSTNFLIGDGGASITSGINNMSLGHGALSTLTTGFECTAVGHQALGGSGSYNTGIGWRAGDGAGTGVLNLFLGAYAGIGALGATSGCVALGASTVLTSGVNNQIALGHSATCSAANQCTIGNGSLTVIRPGGDNKCDLGEGSRAFKDFYFDGDLKNTVLDIDVSGMGGHSLTAAGGKWAFQGTETNIDIYGSVPDATFSRTVQMKIGYADSAYNRSVLFWKQVSSGGASNELGFGVHTVSANIFTIRSDGKNYLQGCRPYTDDTYDLGSASYRWDDIWATNSTIQTSDRKRKREIEDSDLGLEFCCKLKPRKYKFKDGSRPHYGLVAQDVEDELKELKTDFAGFIKGTRDIYEPLRYVQSPEGPACVNPGVKIGEEEFYGLRYQEFIGPMLKGIQELAEKINKIETYIEEQKTRAT